MLKIDATFLRGLLRTIVNEYARPAIGGKSTGEEGVCACLQRVTPPASLEQDRCTHTKRSSAKNPQVRAGCALHQHTRSGRGYQRHLASVLGDILRMSCRTGSSISDRSTARTSSEHPFSFATAVHGDRLFWNVNSPNTLPGSVTTYDSPVSVWIVTPPSRRM